MMNKMEMRKRKTIVKMRKKMKMMTRKKTLRMMKVLSRI